jgi:hypothetical protein
MIYELSKTQGHTASESVASTIQLAPYDVVYLIDTSEILQPYQPEVPMLLGSYGRDHTNICYERGGSK